jgi:hypothetical protein
MIKSIFGKRGKRGKSSQIINKVINGVDLDAIKKDLEKEDIFEEFDECMDEKNGKTNN